MTKPGLQHMLQLQAVSGIFNDDCSNSSGPGLSDRLGPRTGCGPAGSKSPAASLRLAEDGSLIWLHSLGFKRLIAVVED